MSKDLSDFRKSYLKGVLNEGELPGNPIKLFSDWFTFIDSKRIEREPNAMSLSTVNKDNTPNLTLTIMLAIFKYV